MTTNLHEDFVELSGEEFPILQDLRYASSNNFTGKPVYSAARAYLHKEAAELLKQSITIAEMLGYRLKIFDAFRPSEAQWKLWEHTPDPDFLADPNRGSPHSRGVAVDVTLCHMDGSELDMGTGFDEFSLVSHHGNLEISPEAQRNRCLLLGIMTMAGWDYFRNEWWHYQLFSSRGYALFSDEEAGSNLMKKPNLIERIWDKF